MDVLAVARVEFPLDYVRHNLDLEDTGNEQTTLQRRLLHCSKAGLFFASLFRAVLSGIKRILTRCAWRKMASKRDENGEIIWINASYCPYLLIRCLLFPNVSFWGEKVARKIQLPWKLCWKLTKFLQTNKFCNKHRICSKAHSSLASGKVENELKWRVIEVRD